MPVYLCKPGSQAQEPWRHGIQVYAYPFPVDNPQQNTDEATTTHTTAILSEQPNNNDGTSLAQQNMSPSDYASSSNNNPPKGVAIRRVRHAEVVLVDDVCVSFGRYWLRLRWPGPKGGFAGYIALGQIGSKDQEDNNNNLKPLLSQAQQQQPVPLPRTTNLPDRNYQSQVSEVSDRELPEESDQENEQTSSKNDDDNDDYFATTGSGGLEKDENEQTINDDPNSDEMPGLLCIRSGLYYPSSSAMQLLSMYSDGLDSTSPLSTSNGEPVFCRICREGLHDVEVEETPTQGSAAADDAVTPAASQHGGASVQPSQNESLSNLETLVGSRDDVNNDGGNGGGASPMDNSRDDETGREDAAQEETTLLKHSKTGPESPSPYQPNTYAAENPLLAPCECSGSMAFVHYLCVEQWRCRSRHPEARNGLNCETCGSAYALPPPSSRPHIPATHQGIAGLVAEEDWLEAMPAHVLAALRNPHPCWQVGAAIVRRRWLRPIAPVLMSPVVALYCRARRLLKKRGVSRRRWACSLCRRRARWKCVRCLRSYYCSRQCQNVSWHIVHKHVCYKPGRFWWSVAVYGAGTVIAFPGILKDPLIYDLGLTLLPASFLVMGILGGGVATAFKKGPGIDMRGRTLELIVLILTIWLVLVSWGLVWAFFGDVSSCYGAMGTLVVEKGTNDSSILSILGKSLFRPAQKWFLFWDRLGNNSGSWLRKGLCSSNSDEGTCFANLSKANPDFYYQSEGGEKCASDLMLVSSLWLLAAATLVVSTLLKKHERNRRALARARPHQD
mmetsp:Transcript_7706/g.11017  ORF Transcript_7706/g.11017 Transcript_7706/m.11017 type:complete len:784 (+) Transcript_7706:258-2609(+)